MDEETVSPSFDVRLGYNTAHQKATNWKAAFIQTQAVRADVNVFSVLTNSKRLSQPSI